MNRGPRGNSGGGKGGGSGGSSGGSQEDRENKKLNYDRRKTQNKINELLFNNQQNLAAKLIINTASVEQPKEALLSFLLASIDVLEASKKETISKIQIEDTLNNATDFYHYSFKNEDKERIVEIIRDNLVNKATNKGGS